MNVAIARSVKTGEWDPTKHPYLCTADTRYAERVIGNLENDIAFCTSCGDDCTYCRLPYKRTFKDNIVAVIEFPDVLPYVLELPTKYLPRAVPQHDVLIIVNIHEQILLEILKICSSWGTRGVVVPLEAPGWVCGATKNQAYEICAESNIEIAFPKPFCSFKPETGTVLDEFRRYFHIGYPEVKLTVKDGNIIDTDVIVSAACGATYYIARWLKGKRLDENIKIDVVSKRLHSYPCTASMAWDDEINDTPLHIGGHAHYAMLEPIQYTEEEDSQMIASPLGIMVQKAVPVHENLKNIQTAKDYILEMLDKENAMPISRLRSTAAISPAAMSSALLILKKEGKICVVKQKIRKV